MVLLRVFYAISPADEIESQVPRRTHRNCDESVFYFSNLTIHLYSYHEEQRSMATVFIPTPLRRLTGGQSRVTENAVTIGELIQRLEDQYPGIKEKLIDGDGNLKRFINIFRNDDEIRTLEGLETSVGENDKISIVPAMAGGNF